MDKKLARCVGSLKQEAESARGGFVVDFKALLEDLKDLCKELAEPKDVAVACALILEEEDGLLSAVESLMLIRDREAQKGREAILSFMAEFIGQIGERALPYAGQIKEKSLKIFVMDEAKSVKATALTLLIAFFELGILKPGLPDFTVDYELAQVLLKEFRKAKTSNTLKCNILVLLGYLVEYFPNSFTEENVGEILKLCVDIFEGIKTKDPAYILITGATKCLNSILTWFDDGVPAGGSVENSKRIFEYLQQLLLVREDLKRYEVVKAGLHFLSRHASRFRLRLLEKGMQILEWLEAYWSVVEAAVQHASKNGCWLFTCSRHNNASLRDAAVRAHHKFMTEIGSCLVSDDRRIRNPQLIYKSFMKHTLDILDSKDSHHKLVAIAIRALGKLSPAIVKYSGSESLKQAFQRLIPFATRATEVREESLGYTVTLVGAFADMIFQLSEIEDFIVTIIAEVVGNIFYQFPNLFWRQKQAVYLSLQTLFRALYSKGTTFTFFLNNIVWSSLERATEPSEALTPEVGDQLWRHYVDLWSQILDFGAAGVDDFSDSSDKPTDQDVEQDMEQLVAATSSEDDMGNDDLQEAVFDTIIRCIIRSIMGLNVKYRVKQTSVQSAATSALREPDIPENGTGEPQAEMDIVEPLDLVQMQKYLNLVEFTQDFLCRCKAPLFLKWTYTFAQCLIELSSRFPLISGFYKLLAVTINIADKGGYFGGYNDSEFVNSNSPTEDRQLCQELLRSYLEEVVVASRRYKLELLAACLRLCLSSPPGLMQVSSLVAPIKSALRIGLRYNPLAVVAIDALERWHLYRPQDLQPHLDQVVPCLTDYLIEVEATELRNDSETSNRQGKKKTLRLDSTKQIKTNGLEEGPYQLIQVRVQRFLGHLGRYAHHVVSNVDLLNVPGSTGLSWDTGNRVKFVLPFRDIKPDIWLDTLLPRIVDLGLSSSDRRTKITACELLHAVCLLMLGSSAKGPLQRSVGDSGKVQYDKIYRRLFPAVLLLATDVDLVTRQIFQVFSKQLIHWLTSNVNKENPDTMALLDSILDGLVQPDNGSLREFSAECFAEFLLWSIRHTPLEADSIVNVTSMLRRIYNHLDHPHAYHRLGAAMATYCIYPVLRQNSKIVERHILELSYYAVKSLHLAEDDNEQIGTVKQLNRTLWYLEKLMKQTMSSLQERRKSRHIFQTIDEFLGWLFVETGRIQEKCRVKCMSMFSSLCQSIPVGSARGWLLVKAGTSGSVAALVKPFDISLTFPAAPGSMQQMNVWLSNFTRSLHWFTWALKEKMLGVEIIQTMQFICDVQNFLEKLVYVGINTDSDIHIVTPGERDVQLSLKLSAIIYLVRFCVEVFSLDKPWSFPPKKSTSLSDLGEDVRWIVPASDPKFHRLIALLVVKPWDIGFVISDTKKYDELENLLINLLKCGPFYMKAGVIDYLRSFFDEMTWQDAFTLALTESEDSSGRSLLELKHWLKGVQFMQRAGILGMCLEKPRALQIGELLIMSVFNLQRECPPALEPVALDMLIVSRALGVGIEMLLKLVLDERPVQVSSAASKRKLTAGNILYMNFRKMIVHQVKFSYKVSLPILLQSALCNFTSRLLLRALLDELLKSPEDVTRSSILQEFLDKIHYLQPCSTVSSGLPAKQFFLEIIQKLMMLDSNRELVLSGGLTSSKFIKDAYISILTSSQTGMSVEGTSSDQADKDAKQILTSDCLVLIPIFFSYKVEEVFHTRVANCLTNVVTDFLLVGEKELPPQSHERLKYINLLERVLHAVSASKSLELLEALFPLLQFPTQLSANRLRRALQVFAENNKSENIAALNLCYGIMNDTKQAPNLRWAIAETVFPPLVGVSAPSLVVEWYVEHIKAFVEIFGMRVDSNHDPEKEMEDLVLRICHYRIVELLFLTVEDRLLKDTLTTVVPNSRLMKLANDDARAKNDPITKVYEGNAALWRDLHISAYNCLAAIISRTQEQEKFFSVFLFKEGGNVGFIWQHLVDCIKVYDNLPVETISFRAATETVKDIQIQQKQGAKVSGTVSGNLSSQYIIGTTLSQEPAIIGSFMTDISRTVGIDPNSPEIGSETSNNEPIEEVQSVKNSSSLETLETEVLDDDDFDRHPCMGVILKLLDQMQMKFGRHHSSQQMPDWMKALHSSLSSSATPMNVRLFLSKVVTRLWKIFTPYAVDWFRPYVMAVLAEPTKSGGMRFHYLLRELCVCVLQWNLPKPPEAGVGSKLVNHLIKVAVHDSRPVLRANISIIRLFLNAWKEDIQIDRGEIFRYLSAGGRIANPNDLVQRSVGLQLLGAVIASGLPLYDPLDAQTYTEADLYKVLLVNLENKQKDIYEASAELVGMALKQRQEMSFEKDENMLEVPLKKYLLIFFKDSQFDRFLNILNKLTSRFPLLTESYVRMVIDLLPRLHGVYKTIALEILLRSPDSLRSLCSTMVPMFGKLFAHRDESAQLKSLLLLFEILQDIDVEVIRERVLPILCATYSTHENHDCRKKFYDVLIYLYDSKGLKDDKLVLHYLLLGLCEGSDAIRDSIQGFWHSKLSADLALRFGQMLSEMYDPELEERWAQYTDALLLQLCQESVDYRRPIFEAPLSDCEFYEQTINTSWQGGSLPLTPLFSGTQASADSSQDANPQTMDGVGTKFMRQPGIIRGTMTPAFSLTLSQSQGAASTDKVGTTESSLFALSQRPTGDDSKGISDETAKLKRVYQPSIVRASAIRGKRNADRRRQARSEQQAVERSNKVHMMRRYRVGELPDIEIKHEEVIAPLAALALRDKSFARLTLRVLCKAILSLPANGMQDAQQEFKAALKSGIEGALEKTNHGISFVGCLNSICLEDPSLWIRPNLVGSASSKSNNFHSGILLLENQLCYQTVPIAVNTSKRHKGKSGQVSQALSYVDEAWVELAQLYEGISEADIVLALYQKHVAKQSITKLALEAQLGGDHSRALALYDKCLDQLDEVDKNPGAASDGGQVSEAEFQIWDRQRHACLMELNNWQTLVDETLLEIGNEPFDEHSVERLWDVKYKEPYLNFFVKGTAKLTSYHSQLMKFVQVSLEDPSRASFLLESFGTQLLHLAIANDQFDRADLYLSECYTNFRKHWGALHPLAVGSRHLLVQQLQKIVEHEEFVEFIKSGHDSDLQRLLMKWRNRWPSAQTSSVEAWDDTVNSRLLFLNKIQGMANKQLGTKANQGSGQSGLILAAQLDGERAHVYLEAGRGLIKLGAYGVAKGFMQNCEALRTNARYEDYDYQAFKGLVKLQNLQANRIQHLNVKEAISMRTKVLQYIQHTAQNSKRQRNPLWHVTLNLSEASVLSQLGWSSLELLPQSNAEDSALDQSFSRLGSAFSTYQKLGPDLEALRNTGDATVSPRLAAKALYKFGAFCDELLKATNDLKWGPQVRDMLTDGASTMGLPPALAYPSLIVKNLGKAVSLESSLEAQQIVARLISVVSRHPHTQQDFLSVAGQIPTWLFVAWIPQMLATVDEEVGEVMVKVLEDIARLYPQALHYAFQVSKSNFGPAGQQRTERLGFYLHNPVLEVFARVLEDLTFPEQRLQDGLSQIKYSLLAGDRTRAQEVFCQTFQDCVDIEDMKKPNRLAGDYNLKFAENYSKLVLKAFAVNGVKLLDMDEPGFSTAAKDLVSNLNKAVQTLPTGSQSLASLSRWMAEYDGSKDLEVAAPTTAGNKRHVIEIPGQYNGFSKPDPDAHIKVLGFEQTVVTLSSKQRPKLLTIRGSDEHEYKFVVKGGEDLRLDQRIEQLFEVMNSILRRDSACSRRGLSVPTFAVIPVSRRCGLLQFVENTKVLQDVIKDGLSTKLAQQVSQQQKKAADNLLQSLTKQYVDWITEQGAAQNLPACYHRSYSTTRHDQVVQKMMDLQSQMPWDSFRLGMSRLSTSAEAYLSMRSQFVRSLSVVSICGYVTGVGDRHLGNMLVDMQRGSLVPIDFGYSFGTAVILLPVPELIPFRLTRQLMDYLLPLDAINLLRNDMVRAMTALHESRDVICAVLDIFVKEPLVDWKTEATRTATILKAGEPGKAGPENALEQLGEGAQPNTSYEQQHVELKVENAHRKLDLWNPTEVTISELRSSIHADKPYLKALENIVRGDAARNVRARVTNMRCQSVQEQVDCLIDQSTDPNVYGRTWVGWQPWV